MGVAYQQIFTVMYLIKYTFKLTSEATRMFHTFHNATMKAVLSEMLLAIHL